MRFSIIANSSEKYMQLKLGPVVFRDSLKFATASLDALIKSQRKFHPTLRECFPILSNHHPFHLAKPGEATLDLLLRKVPMPYTSITSEQYFELPPVLPREAYDNDLTEEPCTDAEYEMVQRVVEHFGLTDQGQYHDLYLYTDALALADVMEAMRAGWRKHCGLDLFASITLPSASYQAMLKMTGARIELISDDNGGMEFMEAIHEGIRGGVSCIFQPYASANNPRVLPALPGEHSDLNEKVRSGEAVDWHSLPSDYVEWCKTHGYDHTKPRSWIVYVDANSLYPTTMTMSLPTGNYKNETLPTTTAERVQLATELALHYSDDDLRCYFVEVSFRVPAHLHDSLDYAPVARRVVDPSELSSYQRAVGEKLGFCTRTPKLVPYLGEHRNELYHVALLKFWLEKGIELTEVHSLRSCRQSKWMAEYIRGTSAKRASSTDPVEKECIKRGNNSLYGKMLQDASTHRAVRPYTDRKNFVRAVGRERCVDFKVQIDRPGEFFALVESSKPGGPLLNTPRAVGFTILELSKLFMLRAHYGHFKEQYGDRARLLFTDTDSLCYHITCDDVMSDLLCAKAVVFDLLKAFPQAELERRVADPSARAALLDKLRRVKGQLGALKVESGENHIAEFVGLASKMYSILMTMLNGDYSAIMKAKGVPSRVLKALATHQTYKEMVMEPWLNEVQFKAMRSRQHSIETLVLSRKMLTGFNDKVNQFEQLQSRALGHWRNTFATMPTSPASVSSAAPALAPRSEVSTGGASTASSSSGCRAGPSCPFTCPF